MLFRGLSEDELADVASMVNTLKVIAGEHIFHEGDPVDHLYILEKGRIKLTQVNLGGEPIIIHYATPGNAIGVEAVRMLELSTERVERRIANALIRIARQTGIKTPEGVIIDIQLTRQNLAELSGTTQDSVSGILAQWETMGLVKSRRAQVTITYAHGLVRIAEDLPK